MADVSAHGVVPAAAVVPADVILQAVVPAVAVPAAVVPAAAIVPADVVPEAVNPAAVVPAAVVPAAIVPVRMTYVTSYRYENAAYDMHCFLYIFEEPGRDDLIAFSSPWGMTRFHGSVQRHQFNIMALRFHCRGQTEHLRHVLLMRIANNPAVWDGFDYQGRHITMTEIRRYYWHQQAALWVVL